MKKVYIITGANGFLGNNIIRKLQQNKDNEIRALVLKNSSIESLENLNCKIYYGDVTKKDSLSDVFENINDKQVFVIHCAAVVYIKSKFNPTIYNINVNGTKNIIDKVLEKNAKLIYISSVHAIYEKPNNELMTEETDFDENKVKGLYAKTKAETTKYIMDKVKNENLNACIIMPSGIIGPYDFGNSHLTQLIKQVANNKLFATVKGGYDFVDVRDVADGIISACEKDNKNECYILSNKYIREDNYILVPYYTMSGEGLLKCIKPNIIFIDGIGYKGNVLVGFSESPKLIDGVDVILHKDIMKG